MNGWDFIVLLQNSGYKHNKQLNRDSQRVAFLVCREFSVYGLMQILLRSVARTVNWALYA